VTQDYAGWGQAAGPAVEPAEVADEWDDHEAQTASAEHEGETDAAGDAVAGTGHPAVDAAVQAVANAAPLPIAEQLAAYEGAHETLREVLASIED